MPVFPDFHYFRIRDNYIGKHQPRHIKRLAGCHAGNNLVAFRIQLCQRRVAQPCPNQVAVDFVRNDKHVILQTNISKPFQLFLCPDSAAGVMRVAENAQLHLRVFCFRFNIRIIHCIISVVIQQIRADQFNVAMVCRMLEICIGGCQNQHLFVRLADIFHQFKQSGNDARRSHQLFFGELPAIAAF